MKRFLTAAALAATLGFGPSAAMAVFPDKPLTFVVPYGSGGGADLSVRVLAQALSEEVGQPVVVESTAGGGGAVTLGDLFASRPDGYTFSLGTGSNLTVIPHKTPVGYEIDQFSYIAEFFGYPYRNVVNNEVPATNLAELIAWAKSNPDALVSATTGGFDIHEIAMGLLSEEAGGIVYRTLPSNSAAESTARVLAGDANFVIKSPATWMEHIKAESVRVLAVVSNVVGPQLEPMGLEKSMDVLGFESLNNAVLIGPPGMEEDVRMVLQDAVEKALQRSDVIAQMDKIGYVIQFAPGPDAKALTLEASEM